MAQQKPSGNKTRDWIIRIVIFATLGVVLGLAYMDYRTKKQAEQTGMAWREMLKDANADDIAQLPLEKLREGMHGSPEVTEKSQQNVYTWNGTFRDYVITVSYDKGGSKPVQEISGPGEDDAE